MEGVVVHWIVFSMIDWIFSNGEALDRIVEAVPSGVLALLDEYGRDRHIGGH